MCEVYFLGYGVRLKKEAAGTGFWNHWINYMYYSKCKKD
jgi:hypothetical protein